MKSLKEVHIPTLIALLLLVIGIGVSVFLVHHKQKTQTSASVETMPQNLKISNQTAFKGGKAEITISWSTLKPTAGFVLYGFDPNSLNFVSSDIRDKSKASGGYYSNHYVELSNLPPNKTIFYTIGVNNTGVGQCKVDHTFCRSNADCKKGECFPFSLTTPPPLHNQTANLAQGEVLDENKQPVAGAIVFISAPGSNILSSLTDESGQWAINLSLLRQADLSSYFKFDSQASQLSITALYKSKKAEGKCLTANLNPAPPLILNQPYNCQIKKTQLVKTTPTPPTSLPKLTPAPTSSSSGTSKFISDNNSATPSIKLLNPSYEGEKIATSTPIIKGLGPQGKELKITIHSNQEITANVSVDENGQWHWKPPANLEPGEHTITVTYTDDNGQEHKLVRHFYITSDGQAIDETPNYSASASAKIISPTPTPTPTPVPIKKMPSTSSGVPKTGYENSLFLILLGGLMLTIGGKLFYAQSKF